MKKVKLFLVFALLLATVLCATACTQEMVNMLMGTQTCAVHRDLNKDSVCDVCQSQVPAVCKKHLDRNHDGLCDNEDCDATIRVQHYDFDHDGICDELYCDYDEVEFEHIDDDYDRICDECDEEIELDCEECYDDDEDGYCDDCAYPIIICNHYDRNKDDKCDYCKNPMPPPPVCNHIDKDSNGVCELCKEPMPNTIPLVDSKGKTSFKFVLGKGFGATIRRRITALVEELDTLNVNAEINEAAEADYEILFGNVTARPSKYSVDIHAYGVKGYTIQIIGKKIIVMAGSDDAYTQAIEKLRTEIFKIDDKVLDAGKLTNIYLYNDINISKVQNDYKISLITLFGEDIREYKIAYDSNDDDGNVAATKVQTVLYEKTGYWLEITDISNASDKVIILDRVEKCGETGFEAIFEEGKITFRSEYMTTLQKVPYDFFADVLENTDQQNGTLALTAADSQYSKFTKNAHWVYYDDFGAVGDGYVNDADAIYEAHQFAYLGKHTKIVATAGKTYLIGEIGAGATSPIYCDVDWTGAKFIIDDREDVITNGYRGSIFTVTGPSYYSITASNSDFLKQINANGGFKASEMTKFDLGIGHAAMIRVTNSNHKYFIREGVNANDGTTQSELILVDAEGNIDPKVRFLFDYEKVTNVQVYKVDTQTVKPIVIEGGEFTTKAHNQTTSASYTGQRGIMVSRHNVTIKNLKHYVTGEVSGEKGSAYPNFMDINKAYNVLIQDCVFTARTTYYNIKGTSRVGQGTYDITTHDALEVTWKNCTQSNFYNDPNDPSKGRPTKYWGINGGGGSKRVTYDGCTLSRFDAHTGIMHAYIINSIVGSVDLTGGGNLHVINSKVYGTTMIRFREDYGAFWIGDVLLKDATIIDDKGTATTAQLFNTSWVNHYFGYKTALPTSIVVDGLKIEGIPNATKVTSINFFANSYVNNSDKYTALKILEEQSDGSFLEVDNKNIMTPPGAIIVRNNEAGYTYNLDILRSKDFFSETVIEEIPLARIPTCNDHSDEDGDYTCDTCYTYINPAVCSVHMDADHDGHCDVLVCRTPVDQ